MTELSAIEKKAIKKMTPDDAGSGDLNLAQTNIRGKLEIDSSTVNGSLWVGFARVRETANFARIKVTPRKATFDARGIRVAGDLKLREISIDDAKEVCFSLAEIRGVTEIDGLALRAIDSDSVPEVLFRNTRFYGGLRIGQNQNAFSLLSTDESSSEIGEPRGNASDTNDYVLVQLATAYAAYLEDDFGNAWGDKVKLGLERLHL